MNYLKIANSWGMWLAVLPGIALIVFQAILFMKKAFSSGNEMGMSRATLMAGLNAGLISSIGPSFAILIGMMALVVNMGAPFAWMRLSYIGSIMYELLGADMGAMAVGTHLGNPNFGVLAFTSAVWTETLGALGWLIVVAVATPKLEVLRLKMAGGKEAFLPVLTIAAMLGAFSYMAGKDLLIGHGSTVAVLVGMVSMMLLLKIAHKFKQRWLIQWSLGFAMLIGMFVGALF